MNIDNHFNLDELINLLKNLIELLEILVPFVKKLEIKKPLKGAMKYFKKVLKKKR